jgi:drug/metabolite transporter (DMT)-like permease
METVVGITAALAINATLSLGMVLQKKGIGWQIKGREHDVSWRRERRIWFLGFLCVFIIPGLNFLVLYMLSPEIVGAMFGSCVAFTMVFSALILREKTQARKIGASAVLFAGIVVFALSESEQRTYGFSWLPFILIWILPFIAAVVAWVAMRSRFTSHRDDERILRSDSYGAIMGAVSGALGGMIIVFMKLFQTECGTELWRYPLTPFMYAHITVGIGYVYLLQVAYRHGSVKAVAPSTYGSQVAYPVVASWLLSSASPKPVQIAGLVAIIGSVLYLAADSVRSTGTAQEVR